MLSTRKIDPDLNTSKKLDEIETAIHSFLKPLGFKKHGRTLHRFVSGDISQVVHFQTGPSHRGETHLLFVNLGIRVPECTLRSFTPEENPKKYYREYDCNIRSRLGTVEGKAESCYDLRQPGAAIAEDILRQLRKTVLPAFDKLNSREAILAHRREYPYLDIMNDHLILLEEAMIHGRQGNTALAGALFQRYYQLVDDGKSVHSDRRVNQGHLRYLRELAGQLGIALVSPSVRVKKMEALFDQLLRAWQTEPGAFRKNGALQEERQILAAYMDSGLWLSDYTLDAAGAFPPELKRGVLSEDGLYDFLQKTEP